MAIMKAKMEKKLIVVGQVISTGLYGLGRGVIYRIQGKQNLETVTIVLAV
ncbi:hypothetical protein ACUNEV_21960 [Serratia sp. IR-2025]